MQTTRKYLGISVLEAARQRIARVFDDFGRVYVSFSGGKDSSVMLDLVAEEARRRRRRFGLLFLDLEAQYALTIEHVTERFKSLADVAEPYWIALPLHLRNATSSIQPYWVCWDPAARDVWVRQPPEMAITDASAFPWFRAGMEFEEFIDLFGHWYGGDLPTACMVGIRCAESLDRWRAITRPKHRHEGLAWTTWKGRRLYNAYPIYDWRTSDIWTYCARSRAPYNRIYDLMHAAGVAPSQARICQPYGDDQKRGLWLYHILEPSTWPKVVARVTGANAGALYSREKGSINGRGRLVKADGVTWEQYARSLLSSMPADEADHYWDKIATFIRWYLVRGYPDGIPDEADPKEEASRKAPSWRRIVRVLLKNDRLCKGLGFSQQRSTPTSYERYRKIMRERRRQWQIQ